MTIAFPHEVCAVTCTWKTYSICCWSDNSHTKHKWKVFAV